jgi:hypothetical protein
MPVFLEPLPSIKEVRAVEDARKSYKYLNLISTGDADVSGTFTVNQESNSKPPRMFVSVFRYVPVGGMDPML